MCLGALHLRYPRAATSIMPNSHRRYTVHVLIGELHYVCLTSKSDCPSSALQLESCSQIFLERLRTVYRELPMLADLSRDLTNLMVTDLSKPLKKIIVRDEVS